MRIQAGLLLGLLALGATAAAQTSSQPAKPVAATEKLMKIETTGLGG
jgi:hypothetical protein